jgi:peptidyl-prolyl cis-trans isomerase C
MPVNQPKTRAIRSIAAYAVTLLLIFPSISVAASDGKIAVVNDTPVYRQDLDREMKLVALKLARQGRPIDAAELKRYEGNIRETLVNRALLLQQAQAKGMTVKDSLVAKALNEFKAGFEDEKQYQQSLTQMGYTDAQLKEQIKDGLTIKALLEKEVIRKVSVSDKQIRAFYDEHTNLFHHPEQVKASHILIQVSPDADEAKKAEALASIQALKQRIDNGEDFATLAMEYSDGPSKAKGGDLGFFSREQMVQPFSDAAFALKPGQVSDVVTTRFGYHLIRLTERQAPQTMAFNDVKEEISTRLRREQEEKKIDDYLEKLKKHADIQRFPL